MTLVGAGVLVLVAQVTGCSTDEEDRVGTPILPGDRGAEPGAIACDPASAALTPSAVKRLAKAYVRNALGEMFSQLGAATRAQLLTALGSSLDLIPTDVAPAETGPGSTLYASSDQGVSQEHVDAMYRLAVTTASQIADPATPYAAEMLRVCGAAPKLDDDACLTKFVGYYGRKAFRRPLAQAEVDDFKGFYRSAAGAGTNGLFALVGRLIGHPAFYYRFDSEGQVVSGTAGGDAVYRLTKWELLSKVTFLFWGSPPTDELYDYVDATDVTEDANLPPLLDRVLADPRARDGIIGFYRDWLQLDRTLNPATDGNIAASKALVTNAGLQALPPTYRDEMIQEVLDLANHYTLSTEGTLDDIMTSTYSFARTPALASIYGVAPWDGTKEHLVPLPAGQRSGLLTRAAMVSSNSEHTRPIIKGVRILRRVLCTDIPPPPPTVAIKPVVYSPDKTTRQSVEEVTADPTCAGCHNTINPLGYLTENYDSIGRVRDKELHFKDQSADVVSSLPVTTKTVNALGDGKGIADGVELSARIAESGKAEACLVRNYFSFTNGRTIDAKADGCDLEHLREALTGSGGSIRHMLRESVMQKAFRQRRTK
jgi:Protein of unknown function (DUF1588)/Protein of unknown function (DUF1592)/Protein of unknown function (DUF1585)